MSAPTRYTLISDGRGLAIMQEARQGKFVLHSAYLELERLWAKERDRADAIPSPLPEGLKTQMPAKLDVLIEQLEEAFRNPNTRGGNDWITPIQNVLREWRQLKARNQ